jgi:hypothetical protein
MPERPKGKEEESDKIEKSPEFRRFKALLKQVVKAPPMRKQKPPRKAPRPG